jgi:general secretion pathway protein G
MKRKYGFTLVELLIVLAVIAALIATITPLALNAIRRARASQVAQNIRTLASGFENAVLVNDEPPTDIRDIGRDIDTANYGILYFMSGGEYTVSVYSSAQADLTEVQKIINVTETGSVTSANASDTLGDANSGIVYNFLFRVY